MLPLRYILLIIFMAFSSILGTAAVFMTQFTTPETTVLIEAQTMTRTVTQNVTGTETQLLTDTRSVTLEKTETGTHSIQSENGVRDPSKSCGLDDEFFSVSPIPTSDLTDIVPLGNFNPSGHTFPTRHLYFFIRKTIPSDPDTPTVEVPLLSPGNIKIIEISALKHLSKDPPFTDYSIRFSPCSEIRAYFLHVGSISQKISDVFVAPFDWCNDYATGGEDYKLCGKRLSIGFTAGEYMGTAGGPINSALDFGAFDFRTPELQFANPSRWNEDQLHVVCAIDYFTPDIRDELRELLGYGDTVRTEPPICGEVAQDEPGTAKGVWFVDGTVQTYPEDHHITLAYDNIDPTRGVFSVGTSMVKSGLSVGIYYFNPVDLGLTNRDFKDVKADGNIYCYEPREKFKDRSLQFIILLQIIISAEEENKETLRIEKQKSNSCDDESRSFGSSYTDFER